MKKDIKQFLEFTILNIDKPSGPTSFNISDFVRKKLNLRKTSHFGTLDPKVTGVLPIALNRACKLTGHFIGHDKTYVGVMRLHEDISKKQVEEIIKKKFLGKITQLPPVKSRVKRQERQRTIHKFKILEKGELSEKISTNNKKEFREEKGRDTNLGGQINNSRNSKGKDFLFETKVQGGTYIRKLIHDLGEELKVGAHMLELRRTQAGIFNEKDSITLYEFEKAVEENKLDKIIIPAEKAIQKIYPKIEVKESEIKKLFTGKPIYHEDLVKKKKLKKDEKICVFSKEKFIGIYRFTEEDKIFAKPEFVLQPMK